MFRIRVTLDIGKTHAGEPAESLPGEGGPGGAHVELADETPGLRVGFSRPDDDY